MLTPELFSKNISDNAIYSELSMIIDYDKYGVDFDVTSAMLQQFINVLKHTNTDTQTHHYLKTRKTELATLCLKYKIKQ